MRLKLLQHQAMIKMFCVEKKPDLSGVGVGVGEAAGEGDGSSSTKLNSPESDSSRSNVVV